MKRLLHRLSLFGVTLLVALGVLVVVPSSPAMAGTGLFYTVVDADNDPYSGIYLRDGTSMGNVQRIPSRYMLYGTQIELICGTWGESVGPYANRRWHNVRVATGSTTNQVGWIADRYLNTPNAANQYTPNEPECGTPPTYDGAVYFTSAENEGSPAAVHRPISTWAAGDCSSAYGNNFPSWLAPSNKYITTAAGWSKGRLGPIYMLEQTQSNPQGGRWQEIDYILLFDPGNYSDLMGNDCDTRNNRGQLYTKWLKANPNAKLVILSGEMTEQGEGGHEGIQKLYFDYLRTSGGPRDRVLVCNYDGMKHSDVYNNFKGAMNSPPPAGALTAAICPGNENWAWHP